MNDAGSKFWFEYVLLGVLAFLWGSSYLLIRVAVQEIPPVTLIAGRVLIAAVFLAGILVLRREKLPRDLKVWRYLLIQACFNSILAWTVLAWGQQRIDSGMASVLNSTSPLFVILILLCRSSRLSVAPLQILGALVGLLGVVLIIGFNALEGLGDQVAGQFAALVGAFLYGCAAVYGKRFSHLSPVVVASGTMIWACLFLIPSSLMVEQPWELRPSMEALLSVLVLGSLCTGVALILYFRLVRTLGALGVASQAYLRAGVGVLLGFFILGEQIDLIVGVGLGLCLLGVVLVNGKKRRQQTIFPNTEKLQLNSDGLWRSSDSLSCVKPHRMPVC
ncbi:DMT family transporter [Pseudovibrio sp. Tun.PSC04-5.I4]|uniref:DMT family transporter n=1 Tax=Pseudovibrio sp. Tun.PSC04-5.I4 TaxID=1798213 RepID=UPI00088E6B7E|nr:DMT family transporter [Pseudovibrio sp. Tun.PSC04-5.I4]SDR06171.1 Permease of the drug/metabolite transporter (DMT) superfamily [Pseudovibrio sp. Tun.PSC04-5.I4]